MVPPGDGEQATPALHLAQGTIHISPAGSPGRHRNLRFETYEMPIPRADRLTETLERPRKGREMNLRELQAEIARLKQEGRSVRHLEVQWHKKLALPVACLILSLIGPPLAMRMKKVTRGVSLAVSVALAVAYYILLVAGENLGSRGRIDPALGIWAPNLLLGLVAVGLVLGEGREGLVSPRWRSRGRALGARLMRGAWHRKAC